MYASQRRINSNSQATPTDHLKIAARESQKGETKMAARTLATLDVCSQLAMPPNAVHSRDLLTFLIHLKLASSGYEGYEGANQIVSLTLNPSPQL
jgi:hypothetical protein